MKRLGVLLLLTSTLAAAQSQTAAQNNPCSQPEFRQMDFWVGEWDVNWPAQNGRPAGSGTNVVRKILGDCVLEENFAGPAFRGKSLSTFNVSTGKWQQTWVDNSGGYLDFAGGVEGANFVFTREFTRGANKTMQRMVWKNITRDAFDWSWERSTDGGKTWTVLWPIHYARKTRAAAK